MVQKYLHIKRGGTTLYSLYYCNIQYNIPVKIPCWVILIPKKFIVGPYRGSQNGMDTTKLKNIFKN